MGRPHPPLLRLDDALEALGTNGSMGSYHAEVALADVVGTVGRAEDFDATFAPRRRDDRWRHVEQLFRQGSHPPPIEVVRLGDLLFVHDGHHRVSVARSLGWDTLPARVRRVCTVAYALCCLRVCDLPAKAAERRFLERLPLPDEVSRELSLADPADWARLAHTGARLGIHAPRGGSQPPYRARPGQHLVAARGTAGRASPAGGGGRYEPLRRPALRHRSGRT